MRSKRQRQGRRLQRRRWRRCRRRSVRRELGSRTSSPLEPLRSAAGLRPCWVCVCVRCEFHFIRTECMAPAPGAAACSAAARSRSESVAIGRRRGPRAPPGKNAWGRAFCFRTRKLKSQPKSPWQGWHTARLLRIRSANGPPLLRTALPSQAPRALPRPDLLGRQKDFLRRPNRCTV